MDERVGFTAMKDGTKEDYELLARLEKPFLALTAERVLEELRRAGEVIRPFVRWDVSWTVEHHGIFQMLYYAHHYGWDKNARDQFRDHPLFETCAEFCERWDQSSFDPDYPMEPLETFEPMVREVFSRKAYDPEIIREGYISSMIRGISSWQDHF